MDEYAKQKKEEHKQQTEDRKAERALLEDPFQLHYLWLAITNNDTEAFKEAIRRTKGKALHAYGVSNRQKKITEALQHEECWLVALAYGVIDIDFFKECRLSGADYRFYTIEMQDGLEKVSSQFIRDLEKRQIDIDVARFAGYRPTLNPFLHGLPVSAKPGMLILVERVITSGSGDFYRPKDGRAPNRWDNMPDIDPFTGRKCGNYRLRQYNVESDEAKYLQAAATPTNLFSCGDFVGDDSGHPATYPHPIYEQEQIEVVEGLLAKETLISKGIAAVAVGGYATWQNSGYPSIELARFKRWAEANNKKLVVCFDENMLSNKEIYEYAHMVANELEAKIRKLPPQQREKKEGADDYINREGKDVYLAIKLEDPEPYFLEKRGLDPNDPRPPVALPGGGVTITECADQLGELCKDTNLVMWNKKVCIMVFDEKDKEYYFEKADPAHMQSFFERVAQLYRNLKSGPTIDVMTYNNAQAILRCDDFHKHLRNVKRLGPCPILKTDLTQIAGYDPETCTQAFGEPLKFPPIEEARKTLVAPLQDYDFSTGGDWARAYGMLPTRTFVDGGWLGDNKPPTAIIQADKRQTGKDKYIQTRAAIHNIPYEALTASKNTPGGLSGMLSAKVKEGDMDVDFANFRGHLDDVLIESSATSRRQRFRNLWEDAKRYDISRLLQSITSNGMTNTPDGIARSCFINMNHQAGRTDWTFNIPSDVIENWEDCLAAEFACIKDWAENATTTPPTGKEWEGRELYRDPRTNLVKLKTTWDMLPEWWEIAGGFVAHNWPHLPPIDHGHKEAAKAFEGEESQFLRNIVINLPRDDYTSPHSSYDLVEKVKDLVEIPGFFGDMDDAFDQVKGFAKADAILRKQFEEEKKLTFGRLSIVQDKAKKRNGKGVFVYRVFEEVNGRPPEF